VHAVLRLHAVFSVHGVLRLHGVQLHERFADQPTLHFVYCLYGSY
jgi:hypothetical protein